MEKFSITTIIALYGAILSSIVFFWNLYRDLTDKGDVQVLCYIGKFVRQDRVIDDRRHLVFKLTNVGRRPINITTIGGTTKEDQFVIPFRELPKMLEPKEETLRFWPDLSILNDNLIDIWALDSLGKKYKLKRKALKELIRKEKSKHQES